MKYCQKGAMVNVFLGYAAKVVLGNRLQQKHSFSIMLCYNRITDLPHMIPPVKISSS